MVKIITTIGTPPVNKIPRAYLLAFHIDRGIGIDEAPIPFWFLSIQSINLCYDTV